MIRPAKTRMCRVRVTIGCKAPAGIVCRGRIDLDLFGTPAGSRAFRINAGKHPSVPIKLKPKVWKALQSSKRKRLRVNAALSYRSAGETVFRTSTLTVQGPRVRQKQGSTPPHK